MSSKLNLTPIASGASSINQINANFEQIADILDDFLSRNLQSPNQMLGNLDMNGYRIINCPNTDLSTLPTYIITGNQAIGSDRSGTWITNVGTSENLTVTLDLAAQNNFFVFQNATNNYTLTIVPNALDKIHTGTEGKYLRLTTRGLVVIECFYTGQWEITTIVGSYTIEP